MADLAKNDLPTAVDRIKQLDINTMNILYGKIPELEKMYQDVNDCL